MAVNRQSVTPLHREIDSRFNDHELRFSESRCLFHLLFERVLCLINNRFKCGFVGDGQVGENLAVQANASSFKSFGKATVADSVRTSRSIQALDPEVTECAFARFAIAIGPVRSEEHTSELQSSM